MIEPHAYDGGEKGAHRCSKAHRRQCLGEEEDGEVGAGDADGDDRDHIVQEGVDRFPVGREIPREAEVDAGKDAVDDIGTEVFTAEGMTSVSWLTKSEMTHSAQKWTIRVARSPKMMHTLMP